MAKKEPSIIDLPPFVCDDLHFDAKEVDGYQKPFNFVPCCRGSGKSTLMWKKIYNAFKREGAPSIILKRQIVDITEQDITDSITLIEKFTGIRLPLVWTKQDIKQGQMDVYLNGKIFVRYIALSAPMSRLKSKVLRNVKYMFMDEFIVNLRIGEKYLSDEPMRVKEIYTTYDRESEKGIKCYFFGNPYSLYNPYFSWLTVDTTKVYPGSITTGELYVVQCYEMKEELKEIIRKKNPLYQFDEEYKTYAFDGRAIQDADIRIYKEPISGFKLYYCFKLHNKILGVFHGYNEQEDLRYWCRIMSQKELSQRRDIVCFDFGQMANRTVLNNNNGKKLYYYLKECIENRKIAYETIEASYFMEEIYSEI